MRALTALAPLVTSWMLVTVLLTALLAAAATLLHHLARGAFPTRFVWGAAILLAVALSFTQPWRRTSPAPAAALDLRATPVVAQTPAPTPWQSFRAHAGTVADWPGRALGTLSARTAVAAATLARRAPAPVQVGLVLLWPASSLAVLVLLIASYRRHRQLAARAEPQQLHDVPVRVSDELGPLVIGATTAAIIVPRWLLSRTSEEQRLVVQHEQAHVDAHDPLLLLAGCLAAATMPWNPATWYILARLRLAIELDCDARMLAHGASPRRYGQLLIELSAAPSFRSRLHSAPAFSYRASHLERRLHTMTARPTAFRGTRRTLALVVATSAALAACGSELPTSAELEGMDVASATQRLDRIGTPGERRYYIDGRAASETEATALPAERLAAIEIMKEGQGVQAIRLRTRTATDGRAAPSAGSTPVVSMEIRSIDSTSTALRVAKTAAGLAARTDTTAGQMVVRDVMMLRKDGTGDSTSVRVMGGDSVRPLPAKRTFEGLVILDGVPTGESVMRTLPADRIESIEVIKGTAAEKLYGPKGANGVIVIKTKR